MRQRQLKAQKILIMMRKMRTILMMEAIGKAIFIQDYQKPTKTKCNSEEITS